jgi:cell division protein FtsB
MTPPTSFSAACKAPLHYRRLLIQSIPALLERRRSKLTHYRLRGTCSKRYNGVVWDATSFTLELPQGNCDPSVRLGAMKDLHFDKATLYRNGALVLLLASIALIVHNIFGQNGYLALRRQQKELQTLQQQIEQLKLENEQLDKQIKALKSDPAAIERLAREQMHLVKPGEKIYMLPDKAQGNPPRSSAEQTPP